MKQKSGFALLSFTIIVSLMAGTYILLQDWNISGTYGYAASICLSIVAILYAGKPNRSWATLASMLGGATYIYLRATGRINFPLLRYVLGIGMISYGIFGLFMLFKMLHKQEENRG